MITLPQPPEGESESFRIVFEKETDGRWLAEVPQLPGESNLKTCCDSYQGSGFSPAVSAKNEPALAAGVRSA